MSIEDRVYKCLVDRGYGRNDYSQMEYLVRQYIKSSEEMGEIARYLFDGERPPAEEIADAVIPLLAMCAVLGYDFELEVMTKARNDIERGVR